MDHAVTQSGSPQRLQELVGYLNFSSGAADPRFLANLNELFGEVEAAGSPDGPAALVVQCILAQAVEELHRSSAAFRDVDQARSVLPLVFARFLPAYREYHRDLLHHQSAAELWRPFFVGRACEAVLRQGAPWEEADRILTGALAEFNDYLGYRPVAVLHSGQRMEPYAHEWTRPLPLFARQAGIAVGRYSGLIAAALELLGQTSEARLAAAHFSLQRLDELALDTRAYEFDHPANKRPNYHFGQWDPNVIDNRGHYRRFVLQQVTLDALMARVEEPGELPAAERLFEAAAVLAGVMLMASATSGSGPGTYDSSVSLASLMPTVAANRDAFYEELLRRATGERAERLRSEARTARQPFAAARQHLNHALARLRAMQLEQVHLALLYARLGQADAALRQAQAVSVASARMRCEIQCRLTMGERAAAAGRLDEAARLLVESEDFLQRAIQCGALVDPWNILGFQGQFSLFPAPENSVADHRVEQLIELMEQIFELAARVWSEAAARDQESVAKEVARFTESLARWWDQFATTTVASVESFSGAEALESGRQVAAALQAWHRGGASAGNIGFWRKHVTDFHSPKAYALVVEALLRGGDLVAARALLIHWLSQSNHVPLSQGPHSFHALAGRWLSAASEAAVAHQSSAEGSAESGAGPLMARFFDYLEANAEELWSVPSLSSDDAGSSAAEPQHAAAPDEDADSDGDEPGPYDAAYDDMVYVDSTADGVEGEMLEMPGPATDFELEHESRQLRERLGFLAAVAWLWKRAATGQSGAGWGNTARPATVLTDADTLRHWQGETARFQAGLLRLLDAIERRRIPAPSATRDSLMEYERRRSSKEALLETVIATAVTMADVERWLAAADRSELPAPGLADTAAAQDARLFQAVRAADVARVRRLWPEFLERMGREPLLYVPLHKGGDARRVVTVRMRQQTLRDLLCTLPRLGLLTEACQLIDAARKVENDHPVGANAVTEFDRLFTIGYRALVETLVDVSRDWPPSEGQSNADRDLVECLESLTESLLKEWLSHSRTLRLSTLERIGSEREWLALVQFVERYGRDLFTQRFLNAGNLRAILHQGVETWLAHLVDEPQPDEELKLVNDLASGALQRGEAAKHLALVLEAVVENFSEYRDYNSTTTQSDRGELLYSLLDFLRVRVQYDRVAWHLRPVLLAHEILVRNRREEAAEMWRRALAERTSEMADSLLARYDALSRKYSMRLPTIAERLAERFVRPLAVDRLRALVRPAIEELRSGQTSMAFEVLRQEAEELTREPGGAGFELPPWLRALSEEVDESGRAESLRGAEQGPPHIDQLPLTLDDVQRELTAIESLVDF